ncbi:acyltransferase [Geodermatophilus sp. SYSU D00815]
MDSLRAFGRLTRRWVINHVVMREIMPWKVRTRVLCLLGMRIKGAGFSAGSWVGGVDIEMGEGSGTNIGAVFDNLGPIRIGRHVYIGHHVLLLTSHHDVDPEGKHVAGTVRGRGITVHDGVWIGARATVMPGVTIGEGCVIGAGAVVTRDCEPHGMYLGVPARRVKDLRPAAPAPEPREPVETEPAAV